MTDQPVRLRYAMELPLMMEAARAATRVIQRGEGPRWKRELPVVAFCLACGVLGAVFSAEVMANIDLLMALGAGMILGMTVYWLTLRQFHARAVRLRFASALADGEMTSILGPDGWRFEGASSSGRIAWRAVHDVLEISGGIALVIGSGAHPVPDTALPEGMTRADLLARIEGWRAGG